MKEKITEKKKHPIMFFWFLCYLALLFYLLFFAEDYGRTMSERDYRYNLVLFKEIRRFWVNRDILGWQNVIVNIAGNVVAFMPFGFFIPMFCNRGKKFFCCTVLSALFSLAVETVQLITKVGAFDVDDIFLNAIGGLLGYILYRVVWCGMWKKE